MLMRIRKRLEANSRKTQSPRVYVARRVLVDKRYKYPQFTEDEGTALLARLAPDWRLHLHDGVVIDRILDGISA